MADLRIREAIENLVDDGRFDCTKDQIQHGDVTVYDHCVKVTELSLKIAKKLHIRADEESLIRGSLLHDYFLYDWHEKDKEHSMHGFRHPFTAVKRAEEDFELTDKEIDIIKHHMFPLVPIPPKSREAWIVCLADKISATKETVSPYAARIKRLIFA